MKTRLVPSSVKALLFPALALFLSNALANDDTQFAAFLGRKYEDARFAAKGRTVIPGEHRAKGTVDFKFKGTNPGAVTLVFKGKLEGEDKTKRFKGSIDFIHGGQVVFQGLPGEGKKPVTGTYTVNGTTVTFGGSQEVTIQGIATVVTVNGWMTLDASGDVKLKCQVVAAGVGKAVFGMTTAKAPAK